MLLMGLFWKVPFVTTWNNITRHEKRALRLPSHNNTSFLYDSWEFSIHSTSLQPNDAVITAPEAAVTQVEGWEAHFLTF